MKKLTKALALILALIMLFSFAACNGLSDGETTEEATTALAGTVAIPKDQIKVGILHITSKDDTSGYTFAHHSGFLEMQKNLGLSDSQIVVKDEIYDDQAQLINNALQELIDEDCNIIFATSFGYMDFIEEFANKPEYQDIIFSHCSGYKSNDVNFNNYFGRIYEARYLAGIAAGMKAKELGVPKLGYVAAMGEFMAEVTGGVNAWALGAQSVYPEVEVKVSVTGSWYDPEEEAKSAQALIDAGCVVIGQHCDTNGPQTTAEDNGVFGCGYNSDMTEFAPKAHLCAPIWNWGVYYTQAVQAAINGTWTPTNYYEGMKVGLVDISPLNEDIAAPGTKEAIEAARAKILSGELIIFSADVVEKSSPVVEVDADGKPLRDKPIKGENADGSLSDGQITGGINQYIKGVSLL